MWHIEQDLLAKEEEEESGGDDALEEQGESYLARHSAYVAGQYAGTCVVVACCETYKCMKPYATSV